MGFAAAVSRHPLPTHAAGEVIGAVLEDLESAPDLAILLVTGPFAGALEDMAATVTRLLDPVAFVAMVTGSVLTADGPVTEGAAAVLFAASWNGRLRPGSRGLRTVAFEVADTDVGWHVRGTEDLAGARGTLLTMVGDEGFPTEPFLAELRRRNPDLIVAGGVASTPMEPAPAGLIVDDRPVGRGAAGILLPEGTPVRAVISQGTRPVGEPFVVTAAADGLVGELGGRPALDRVLEIAHRASEEDRRALAREMNLGLFLTERPDEPRPGDVLVRRLPGADRRTGAVAVDGDVAVGTTVQIHARDARAAEEDLLASLTGETAAGAFVFADQRRGGIGAGVPDRDVAIIDAQVGHRSLAGSGCAGVFGPIAKRPWIHSGGLVALLFDD